MRRALTTIAALRLLAQDTLNAQQPARRGAAAPAPTPSTASDLPAPPGPRRGADDLALAASVCFSFSIAVRDSTSFWRSK